VQVGNCGAPSQRSDFIVALSTVQYNNGAHCWQHVKVRYNGNTIDVTVVDSCPRCAQYGIDLSPGAFQALAPLGTGSIPVSWWYA
ncbi:Papain inhibitor, partial [Leucoagaricus sp. SymC.cos]